MDDERDPQTEERVSLVPPARRPPTALGAATPPPPPPPRPPRRHHEGPRPYRRRTDIRRAVLGLLDAGFAVGDAMALAIERTLGIRQRR